ncbi:MAG: O-antigen ligase family protein [Cyanobacteria bacterium REEB67]|nr:O-antigen ligase family protein [Cyanobacteria bacterium REEB67]
MNQFNSPAPAPDANNGPGAALKSSGLAASLAAAVAFASLAGYDRGFQGAIEGSALARPFFAIFEILKTTLAKIELVRQGRLGSIIQNASYLLLLLLFACLGLPQFASDKEGLAFISLTALIVFSAGRLLGGRSGRDWLASDGLVLGYFGANVIAAFASHYLPESFKGLSKVAVYILTYFFLTASLQGSRRKLGGAWVVTLLTGFAVSLYGLYQYKIGVAPLATWEDPTVDSKETRVFSTLGNPNLLAGYLIPMVPVAFSLSLCAFFIKSKMKWPAAFFGFALTAVIAAATWLTGSRGGYLSLAAMAGAFALAALAYLLRHKPKLVLPSLLGILLLLVAGVAAVHFLAPSYEQRITSIFAGSAHSSNAYRQYVWRASLRMFEDNWWFGVGPGNTAFRLAYGLYMESGFDALGTYCVPLEVGVECGIIGLFFFAALIVNAFACAHIAFWRADDKVGTLLAIGLAAALVGLMTQGMVDTVFYRPQVHFIFWLVIASLLELPRKLI